MDTLTNNFPDYSLLDSYCDKSFSSEKNCFVKMDLDLDYAIAMSLQEEFDDEIKENASTNSENCEGYKPLSIVDKQWELIDPLPDIHALFVEFEKRFFYGKLKSVEVRWSSRMTLCAGICSYQGRGGLCSIALSEPLLKLRPRQDLVETLLHEMIHAYLFVTENNKDRDGHGPNFLSHMHRINREAGTKITVYHSFHDEVNLYKQHWWKCDGPCRNRSPFFGLVKRSMNRAPGPNDKWWSTHQLSCGGKFIKIKEPNNFKESKILKRKLQSDPKSKSPDIRKFIKSNNHKENNKEIYQPRTLDSDSALFKQKATLPIKDSLGSENATDMPKKGNFIPFQGTGHKLGISSGSSKVLSNIRSPNLKNLHSESKIDFSPSLFRYTNNKETCVSPRKNLIKKVVPPTSTGKVLSKKDFYPCSSSKASPNSCSPRKVTHTYDLFSSSLRKEPPEKHFTSSLSEKFLTVIPPSRSAQNPKRSNSDEVHYLQSVLGFSSKTSTHKTNRSETIAVENSLSPRKSDYLKESCVTVVDISNSASTKMYCPVCSNLVNEEINAHLDKCLNNSTV